MKVVVTGATGFVGRHLVKKLLRNGHKVIAVARNLKRAEEFEWFEEVRFVQADLHRNYCPVIEELEEGIEGSEDKVVKVSIDYCFMGSKGLVKDWAWRDNDGREADGVEAKGNPILAMQGDGHQRVFAYPVQKKGAYEAVVEQMVKDLGSIGK